MNGCNKWEGLLFYKLMYIVFVVLFVVVVVVVIFNKNYRENYVLGAAALFSFYFFLSLSPPFFSFKSLQ